MRATSLPFRVSPVPSSRASGVGVGIGIGIEPDGQTEGVPHGIRAPTRGAPTPVAGAGHVGLQR